jgi:type VI secretion system protein ImpG
MRDDGSSRPWRPFYRHPPDTVRDTDIGGVYLPVRRESPAPATGTDVLLAPLDPDLSVDQPAGTVLSVDAICTNRDLPDQLPFGGGQLRLNLAEGISGVAGLVCLTAPTPCWRPALREQRSWRLISHLSLGHLSVVDSNAGAGVDSNAGAGVDSNAGAGVDSNAGAGVDSNAGAEMLREVLRLYDVRDTGDTRTAIDGLLAVHAKDGTARVPGARPGSFCRGLDVTLEFDAKAWDSAGSFLLATVLERFLALRCAANTFVRTTATVRGRPGDGARFPPRAGARVLL